MPEFSGDLGSQLRSFADSLASGIAARAGELWRSGPEGQLILGAIFGLVMLGLIGLAHYADIVQRDSYGPNQPRPRIAPPLPPVNRASYKPRGTLYVPWQLGNVTIDLQPRATETMHAAVDGRSRLGKSTCVLPLLDLDIGVLVVSLDNTYPIMQKIRSLPKGTWYEWTNHPKECKIGLDLLGTKNDPPAVMAELLVEGIPKSEGDTGDWRRSAMARIMVTMQALDAAGQPRDWQPIIKALYAKTKNTDADIGCRKWANKLITVHTLMGSTFGPDLNVINALRQRKKVLLRLNNYLSPASTPLLGGWLMVYARYYAQEVGMPFILIVDEAGQMDTYKSHMKPIAQAAADRQVPLVAISQNLSVLPIEVVNNFSVWVTFGLEEESEQRFMAHKLELKPEQLRVSAFPGKGTDQGRGWCYVKAPGMETRLVKVKSSVPTGTRQRSGLTRDENEVSGTGSTQPSVSSWEIVDPGEELGTWQPESLALPGPRQASPVGPEIILESEPEPIRPMGVEVPPQPIASSQALLRMWKNSRREPGPAWLWCPCHGLRKVAQGCRRWTAGFTTAKRGKPPRPRSSMPGRKDVTPYIEFYRVMVGSPEPTLDHLCGNEWCVDWEHLEACSIAENNARNTPRAQAFATIKDAA